MNSRLVIPGELVTEKRMKLGPHVFVEKGKIYSDTLGLVKMERGVVRVVPLQGKYMPKANDVVVGIVVAEEYSFYIIDINSFYYSFLPKEEIKLPLKKGSIVSAKIARVNEINEVSLSNIRVLHGGEIIPIAPTRVPRVIGKNASMLKLLQHGTKCAIIVGMNGWVWAKGREENIRLLKKALQKIERESHLSNLTLKIQKMLSSKEADKV
ncbi:MAG: hypothetical protein J7L44_03995 [Candidatus Diapherotrites archaeon]|nr:hypothetical protein [Candidatus Diapherotrites archaeon]